MARDGVHPRFASDLQIEHRVGRIRGAVNEQQRPLGAERGQIRRPRVADVDAECPVIEDVIALVVAVIRNARPPPLAVSGGTCPIGISVYRHSEAAAEEAPSRRTCSYSAESPPRAAARRSMGDLHRQRDDERAAKRKAIERVRFSNAGRFAA